MLRCGRIKIITLLCIAASCFSSELLEKIHDPSIKKIYDYYAGLSPRYCDIGEHFPLLMQLAVECPHVTEIGLGLVISTWAIFQGLTENPDSHRSYLGIDIAQPPIDNMALAQSEAEKNGISFRFQRVNDLYIDIDPTDLLFIDSMHTYCHLTFELETFSPKVRKFIAMHDTSEPWGNRDDDEYRGNYSEYPAHYHRSKRGLWPAVEDFLKRHPEWTLQERRLNCHGFTVLKRTDQEEK